MKIVGIDIGSTTTKAVAMEGGEIVKKIKTKASDAITSATGALGKVLSESNSSIEEVEKIIITGAGSVYIKDEIFGIPTTKIDEITAIGLGGIYLSGEKPVLIANIGTGTSIIEASNSTINHLGGTGIGGGTITGLSKLLLNSTEFDTILDYAERGDHTKVDLLIEDISDLDISFLDKKSTAANFGKMLDSAGKEDYAAAVINMVFQVIGMISLFAARSIGMDKVLVTGNGSKNKIGRRTLTGISRLYGIKFEYPNEAEYTTAIGAAISGE